MFPNYCFKKRADDFGYEVLYLPKDNYDPNAHQSNRSLNHSHASSRSRQHQCQKMCYENLIRMQALQEQMERNGLKSQTSSPVRNVQFRLPPQDKQGQFPHRQSGGSAPSERELYIKQQQQHQQNQQQQQQHQQQKQAQQHQQHQQQTESPSDLPSSASDSVQNLQDSCADFFNIIYENVLEAVNGAVELTVAKHFQDILTKVNQLRSEMTVQQNMLKQTNSDLLDKISELNETNLNQFKFIAQMLIDSQTIHYRAMNQQQVIKQQTNIQPEHPKRSVSSERTQRAMNGCSRCQNVNIKVTPPQQIQRPQHQLWQQQETTHMTYLQPPSIISHMQKLSSKSDRRIFRRSPKGISTVSMPNLHKSSLSASTPINSNVKIKAQCPQHSSTPSSWSQFGHQRVKNPTTSSSTSSNSKKCRCHCHTPVPTESINYLLSNNPTLGRKLQSLNQTFPSMENRRMHT